MRGFWITAVGLMAAAALAALLLGRQPTVEAPGIVDLEAAFRRVQAAPHDPGAWGALGDAQSAVDQLRAAEESYRTAMRLSSDDPRVMARLGFLLYGRGEDVPALALLEQARLHGAELPMLDYTIRQLQRAAADATPPPPAPVVLAQITGTAPAAAPAADRPCALALDARSTLRLPAQIEGADVTLIFDTGASLTTLDQGLLEARGILIDDQQAIHAVTAVGSVRFPTAVIKRLSIAGRSVDNLTVAVCRGCGGPTGGLLGLDVMAALGIDLDLAGAQLRFRDCAGR